jgi:hypothetical protein
MELNPKAEHKEQALKVLKVCDANRTNEVDLQYDERNPFVICTYARTPPSSPLAPPSYPYLCPYISSMLASRPPLLTRVPPAFLSSLRGGPPLLSTREPLPRCHASRHVFDVYGGASLFVPSRPRGSRTGVGFRRGGAVLPLVSSLGFRVQQSRVEGSGG